MTIQTPFLAGETLALFAAAEDAIGHVPPAFPLDATVAVNPWLGQAGDSRLMAAARLERVAGVATTIARADVAARIAEGRITDADLDFAAHEAGLKADALKAAAHEAPLPLRPDPTVADLAAALDGVDWPELLGDRIGLWAAAHFDNGQALWPVPGGSAYASWRAFAARDLTPEIAGLSGFCARVGALPATAKEAFAFCCTTLGLTPASAPLYLHRLLTSLGGWSQVARAKGWLAERDGGRDTSAFDLLTIRLAWEIALLDRGDAVLGGEWAKTREIWAEPLAPTPAQRVDAALQEAADRAEERALTARLTGEIAPAARQARPAIQAAFCIDVRSEVFRRALEAADAEVETIGFAGFFGLAVAHRGLASDVVEARAPVLLKPGVESVSSAAAEPDMAQRLAARAARAWGRFRIAAVSSFAFVESMGPIYAGKLIVSSRGTRATITDGPAPAVDLPLSARVDAARTILGAMSLTRNFAPLVLIAGHGAEVTNAPHASALQCGACGGHAGDVNARLLAGLLNDAEVRAGLADRGIEVPADTRFVAGMHDTVTDTVRLFDTKGVEGIARLKQVLKRAGALARAERALVLPRADDPETLARRGEDWAEVRPEWGLAGCAAFIAAPRMRTAGRDLGGRSFLHSYDWRADDGFGVLELILTAPVVVASWIALQYHGSSVAPEAFGGGNKLLHNVTGGIGVVEGAGGLLRPGLPWQSVHDGDRLRHDPVRLSVVIEAPAEAISEVLNRHPGVRDLFDNGWLSLHVMDDAGKLAARYADGAWLEAGGADVATAPEADRSAA